MLVGCNACGYALDTGLGLRQASIQPVVSEETGAETSVLVAVMTSDIVIAYIWDVVICNYLASLLALPMFGPVIVVMSLLMLVCTASLYALTKEILNDIFNRKA